MCFHLWYSLANPVRSSLGPVLNRTFDSVSLWCLLSFYFGAKFDGKFQSWKGVFMPSLFLFCCRIWLWVSILKVSWTARFIRWMAFKLEMKWKAFCKTHFLYHLRSLRTRGLEGACRAPTGQASMQSSPQKLSEEMHLAGAWLGMVVCVVPLSSPPPGPQTAGKVAKMGLMCTRACCLGLELQMPPCTLRFLSNQKSWHWTQLPRDSSSSLPWDQIKKKHMSPCPASTKTSEL